MAFCDQQRGHTGNGSYRTEKTSEDRTFALMDNDLKAYAEKHIATIKKRMEGHTPEFLGSFADRYGL
jgi:hypothetical protein